MQGFLLCRPKAKEDFLNWSLSWRQMVKLQQDIAAKVYAYRH